ncbi:hypothetical protein [Nonomuraea sp. NPDC050310]|uniref:hypothetical protein n=1 Tax=Nonomuraea sp. NPDC050310 TaxID=3154935 RepID=UPI0033ED502F
MPDVVIERTTVDDWQTLIDLVRTRGWRHAYSLSGKPKRLPAAAEMVAAAAEGKASELRVWPVPDVLAIFRVYRAVSIDFDVDLRELQGQERLDILVAFLKAIGRALGKSVLMTPEGCGRPDLGFDVAADRAVRMSDPRG